MVDHRQPVPQGAEQILAVIPSLTRVSGFMSLKQRPCALVLTNYRVLFAALSNERMKQVLRQARGAAKLEGEGFLGRWRAQVHAVCDYQQQYWNMAPEAILAEDPSNFAVGWADIKRLKFKAGKTDAETSQPDKMIMQTTTEKLKFHVGGDLSQAGEAFRAAGFPG